MAYIFFDQNVMEKMSKKNHKLFQDNVEKLLLERTWKNQQLLTPFSLLEFGWLNRTENKTFDIQYKGKRFNEYPFQSYQELDDENIEKHLKAQIQQKVTKLSLEEIFKGKKQRESKYLNDRGSYYIEHYIKKIDSMYDDLVCNLFLDQLAQTNISKFSLIDKWKFINLCTKLVIHIICEKESMGSLRMVYKLFDELRKLPDKEKENSEFYKINKKIPKILEGSSLKSQRDFVDRELIHLAFFGWKNDVCHIYTTDSESTITTRLKLYCCYIKFIVWFSFEYPKQSGRPSLSQIPNNKRPEWKCGKIFILNKRAGEKIKKISVAKIHEGKNETIYENQKESV